MCGIVGAVGNVTPFKARLHDALNIVRHRGPDGSGQFESAHVLLGHRRLAIIDLSDNGAQPMIDDLGIAITYNGEIYNYIELRSELEHLGHKFSSQSDTEVILKSYRQWGAGCVARFNGMWAFCLWDPRRNIAILSRDHFGIKPLYLASRDGALLFGSEPKALTALAPCLNQPDSEGIGRFIAYGELYSRGRSFYDGITVFPAGCYAEIEPNNPVCTPIKYWSLCHSSPKESVDQESFNGLLDDAIRIRMRSDVPVGLTLSGGLDSSCILLGMRKASASAPVCLTAAYGVSEGGEQGWAALAAAKCHSQLVAVVASENNWLQTLERIAWHMDGPGYSPAVYPTWKIMSEARARGIPVLLEGQGADEAFGGYPQYGAIAGIHAMRMGPVIALRTGKQLSRSFGAGTIIGWMLRMLMPRLFSQYQAYTGGRALLRKDLADQLPASEMDQRWSHRMEEPITQRLALDFQDLVLPGLLQYGDAISMAHSVESRLPFLDVRLINYIFAARDIFKVDAGITKPVLRAYLREGGLPMIADRHDKLGYPTPLARWIVRNKEALVKLLTGRDSRITEFCSVAAIHKLCSQATTAGSASTTLLLYKLISLELWLRSRAASL